ncbi:hypothetical protein QQ045_033604 [Rhodiola kirilowii]
MLPTRGGGRLVKESTLDAIGSLHGNKRYIEEMENTREHFEEGEVAEKDGKRIVVDQEKATSVGGFGEHVKAFWQVKTAENRAAGAVKQLKFHKELLSMSEIIVTEEFFKEEEFNRILALGPWYFDNRPLILKPWSPDENYELESVTSLPIWMRFPGLNLHMRSEEILSMLASTVGKPIRTDAFTASNEKLSYA